MTDHVAEIIALVTQDANDRSIQEWLDSYFQSRLVKLLPSPNDDRLGSMRMVLCKVCGNKRCPHATDESLECTGSNEPGQAGSRYE